MVRTSRIAILVALVLSVSGRLVNGQAVEGEGQGRVAIVTSSGPVPTASMPFQRAEAMVWLAVQGIRSNGPRIPARFLPQDTAAPYLEADSLLLDRWANVVVAEGNVTVTATREDGSTVTLRTDRMTIEQGQ